MKKNISTAILLISLAISQSAFSQIYSFENGIVPEDWKADKGTLSISSEKYKSGTQSLQINWKQGDILTIPSPAGISEACKSKNGGMNVWIYNESPIKEKIVFSFRNEAEKEVCQLPFLLNFKGWRCIWAKFQGDMNMPSKSSIQSVEIQFPQHTQKGVTYIDLLEFTPKVSWQNMSDAQYKVNRTDYSLIPDFTGYRNCLLYTSPSPRD